MTLARVGGGLQVLLGASLVGGAGEAVATDRLGSTAGLGVATLGGMIAVSALAMARAPMRHRAWRPMLFCVGGLLGYATSGLVDVEVVLAAVASLAALCVWTCWDMTEPWIVGVAGAGRVAPGSPSDGVSPGTPPR